MSVLKDYLKRWVFIPGSLMWYSIFSILIIRHSDSFLSCEYRYMYITSFSCFTTSMPCFHDSLHFINGRSSRHNSTFIRQTLWHSGFESRYVKKWDWGHFLKFISGVIIFHVFIFVRCSGLLIVRYQQSFIRCIRKHTTWKYTIGRDSIHHLLSLIHFRAFHDT